MADTPFVGETIVTEVLPPTFVRNPFTVVPFTNE